MELYQLGLLGLGCLSLIFAPLFFKKYWKRFKILYDPTVQRDWQSKE